MGTYLRAFLNQANRNFLLFLLRQLHDAAGSREPRGAGANDDHIEFHSFTFHSRVLLFSFAGRGKARRSEGRKYIISKG